MNGHPKNLRVAPAGTANGAKVDPNDPQVRKLVYNAYREMLSKKHADANVIVDNAPQELVTEDQGVGSRVESMMRQQSELKGGNMNAGGPPPPPPPPPIPGVIPSSRLPSEIPPRPAMNTPPAALAGAMMKDRKPFTYTPGGLDLSEISNQYPPNQNGNNVDQAPNNADFGAPVQSRSFRVLQNVLDHHDTTGSDDEISKYMQPIVPQAQASVSEGGHHSQQPIYNQTQCQPQQISEQDLSTSQAHSENNPQYPKSGMCSTQNVNMPQPKEGPTTSRFFRMLQTITDTLPHGAEPQGPIHIPNMRQVQPPSQYQPQPNQYQQQPEYQQQTGPYLQSGVNNNAASTEQAIPEPKKYMGGSIPSRSFRMLQAMTGADDVPGPGQSDL